MDKCTATALGLMAGLMVGLMVVLGGCGANQELSWTGGAKERRQQDMHLKVASELVFNF